jgi:hypothetical protein
MSTSFICSICGKEHDRLLANWAYTLPDEVWAIAEDERRKQARYNEDLCQWGERYFIRCILPIPLSEVEGEFNWGAWAEVERSAFERYIALFDEDGAAEPRKNGRLANALLPYVGSLGTEVSIQFRGPTERPTLHLSLSDRSLLAEEQRSGIDSARHHKILALL